MALVRRVERVTPMVYAGTTFTLVETNRFFLVGRGRRGGGFSYRSPTAVAIGGTPPVRIHDHVMLARLVAVALAATLAVWTLACRQRPIDGGMNR